MRPRGSIGTFVARAPLNVRVITCGAPAKSASISGISGIGIVCETLESVSGCTSSVFVIGS